MTDRLLGRMLDRLRDLGTYDESLVVVTADHGISFSAGERIRGVTDENPNEILWTPLFVKAPGQRRGEVVDAPMRAVDIVPTIADILGLDIPWEIDGVAASDPRPASYDRPRILDWRYSRAEPDDGDYFTVEGDESYAEVLEARPSGVGGDPDARLYRRGRYGRIVGRRVDDLDVGSEAPFGGELNPPGPEPVVEADATSLPVYLVGKLPGGPEVEVAVAVNGVVGTVTDVTYPFGPSARIFTTVVPEHLLREGRNEIELYLLEGGSVPTLHPIPTVEAES
jgi:hypothetical protein